jgi:hypothetical protein
MDGTEKQKAERPPDNGYIEETRNKPPKNSKRDLKEK